MIIVLDNYDSFVHNLARYCVVAAHEVRVVRNDAVTVHEIKMMNPDALIISPGPDAPAQAGISKNAILALADHMPILGVCLGHQCIGEVYGGRIVPAPLPMHGMACTITHDGSGVFKNMPNPMDAGRYHSLMVEGDMKALRVTARDSHGVIMGLQHKELPIFGVQFHPESILTPDGAALIHNFLDYVREGVSC